MVLCRRGESRGEADGPSSGLVRGSLAGVSAVALSSTTAEPDGCRCCWGSGLVVIVVVRWS
jgi:hypothetical protein